MKHEKSDINDLINENIKLRELLSSIVSDVEAMRTDMPEWQDTIGEEGEKEHWFGGFADGTQDHDNYTGTYIQWPNISILIEQAKELLTKETKWTTNKRFAIGGQPIKI